jgi:hypothetical protein
MKSLLIAPDDGVHVIDLDSMKDVRSLIGNFDLVDLGDDLLMAIKNTGLMIGMPPNRRATLFVATMLNVIVPISGSTIVFMETSEDLNLKTLPDWVQHAIAAPFN